MKDDQCCYGAFHIEATCRSKTRVLLQRLVRVLRFQRDPQIEPTATYTPQQTKFERFNRTIIKKVRAMLIKVEYPKTMERSGSSGDIQPMLYHFGRLLQKSGLVTNQTRANYMFLAVIYLLGYLRNREESWILKANSLWRLATHQTPTICGIKRRNNYS